MQRKLQQKKEVIYSSVPNNTAGPNKSVGGKFST